VCCVIAVLLCLSVFESLRIREIRKAWKGFGDVEVSVGVRSIWRTWTLGSTEDSTCVVRFPDPLFWLQSNHNIISKLKHYALFLLMSCL
jgi:hypothetical protein